MGKKIRVTSRTFRNDDGSVRNKPKETPDKQEETVVPSYIPVSGFSVVNESRTRFVIPDMNVSIGTRLTQDAGRLRPARVGEEPVAIAVSSDEILITGPVFTARQEPNRNGDVFAEGALSTFGPRTRPVADSFGRTPRVEHREEMLLSRRSAQILRELDDRDTLAEDACYCDGGPDPLERRVNGPYGSMQLPFTSKVDEPLGTGEKIIVVSILLGLIFFLSWITAKFLGG